MSSARKNAARRKADQAYDDLNQKYMMASHQYDVMKSLAGLVAKEAKRLEEENKLLRNDVIEWLCPSCNLIHPHQKPGILQPCPTCSIAMLPTSPNLRRIEELTRPT